MTIKQNLEKMISHHIEAISNPADTEHKAAAEQYLNMAITATMNKIVHESEEKSISCLYVKYPDAEKYSLEFSGDAGEVKQELKDMKASGSWEKGTKSKIVSYPSGEKAPTTID